MHKLNADLNKSESKSRSAETVIEHEGLNSASSPKMATCSFITQV